MVKAVASQQENDGFLLYIYKIVFPLLTVCVCPEQSSSAQFWSVLTSNLLYSELKTDILKHY